MMPTRHPSLSVALALLAGLAGAANAEMPPATDQIHAAVSAAPEALRDGATVLGYGESGELVELRKGSGELVCLADDPSDERFHVACYHRSLEPFMARGRALRKEGRDRADIVRIRGEEIAAGTLPFPSAPAALYSLTGPAGSFDAEAQIVRGGNRVHSIYVAHATGETTGLPTSPSGGETPWLMAAGEPWAHIMLVQPSDAGAEQESE